MDLKAESNNLSLVVSRRRNDWLLLRRGYGGKVVALLIIRGLGESPQTLFDPVQSSLSASIGWIRDAFRAGR